MTKTRIGKREREARKRHRRGGVAFAATEWETLKLGNRKFARWLGWSLASVGGRCRKSGGKRALETHRRTSPNSA